MRASSTCTPFPIETNSLSVCPLCLPARNPAPCLSRLGERLPVMTTEKINSLRPQYPKQDPKKSHWFQLWKTHWLHNEPIIHSKNSNRLQLIFTVNPFQPVSRSWLLHLKSCSSTSKIQNLLVRKSTGIYSKQETTGSKASWKSHPILFHLDNFD